MRFDYPNANHTKTAFIRLERDLCQACGACSAACPNGVIGQLEIRWHKHAHIDKAARCKGCRKCVTACPNGAIIYTYAPKVAC